MSSSRKWLREHFEDPYVKRSKQEGYPSRAAYKLLEIQKKDHLLKPGMRVLDLGAAPGGWSMVARELIGKNGKVIAVDLLPLEISGDIEFIQGDFTEQVILDKILNSVQNEQIDLVLSDMAPNISGMKSIDQPRAMYLIELALDCAIKVLRPGGNFLVKAFNGAGLEEYRKAVSLHFKTVKFRKPDASRARSSEIYILGCEFIGYNE